MTEKTFASQADLEEKKVTFERLSDHVLEPEDHLHG